MLSGESGRTALFPSSTPDSPRWHGRLNALTWRRNADIERARWSLRTCATGCRALVERSKFMKLHRFLPGRGSAGSWRHQEDTGTVTPRKPTSSGLLRTGRRWPAHGCKDLLPNLGGACPRREAATRPFGARTVVRPSDAIGCRLWAGRKSAPPAGIVLPIYRRLIDAYAPCFSSAF
jgi:hypothetical protein